MRNFVTCLIDRLLGRHSVDAIMGKHAKTVTHLERVRDRMYKKNARHLNAVCAHQYRAEAAQAEAARAHRVAGKLKELVA